MPIVNGDMYPELKIHPVDNKRLIVAIYDISDEDAISLAHKVAVATAYIEEKFTDLCGVQRDVAQRPRVVADRARGRWPGRRRRDREREHSRGQEVQAASSQLTTARARVAVPRA